jgi:ketosteroid isomerase-like protein
MKVNDIVVHETTDPDVIIGEFQSRITSTQTGKQATTRNIMVVRFRDGKVVSSRDYHNLALIAELAGGSRT